jgi:putative transposase
MPRCRFESGTKFFMDDLEHMILRVESKKITIEVLKYKQAKICSLRELEEAFDEERLVFEDPGNRSNLVKLDPVDLTETEHAHLKMKISVLEPVIHDRFHKINVDDYLKSLREEKGLSISRATFYNWKKEWDQYGDARYLQKLKPGPKTRRHEKEVLGVISEIMEDNLYTGEDIDYSYIYGMYKDRIKEINELREDDVKLLIRSFQTIWRIVKEKRDFYRQKAATDGRVAARLERDGVKSMSERPIRPLERVELDWTPVDLLSVDPKTLQRKRAWIVYAIDVCTGEPLGFYITYDYPDTFAIKQCLLHCFLPKTYVKKLYPEVQNEWTAYGIPKELVIDNHKANDSFELEEIFELFGIDPLYPEIEAGHKKGTVERVLKTFNRLMRKLKGTTKSNFLDRKQYDSEGKACITLQGLYYIAHIFFVDIVSHNWSHSRMGGTPHQIWERAYETDPTLVKELPFSKKEIKLALCAGREKRTIQNKGITLERGRYWSDELAKIRYRLLQEGDEGREVTVRFDWM